MIYFGEFRCTYLGADDNQVECVYQVGPHLDCTLAHHDLLPCLFRDVKNKGELWVLLGADFHHQVLVTFYVSIALFDNNQML